MLDTAHLLLPTDFPELTRRKLETLQVNLGYICNQTCQHCHVNAGPKRTESMSRETVDQVLDFIDVQAVSALDLTGGAPELNPHFRYLVSESRKRGVTVMDRCNLTVLEEPGQEGLGRFMAENGIEIYASMPCYLEENVDSQRGSGVYEKSIRSLKQLNTLGYGRPGSGLMINLVYNPLGPTLPPPQKSLEADYKRKLADDHGVLFNQLLTITNMPISRFGSMLVSKGEWDAYMGLLKSAYSETNMETVMCRSLISIDWKGYVYDCDFNQMLGMHAIHNGTAASHIAELLNERLEGKSIRIGEHCYGCTAGQGSSCGGALTD